MTGVTRVAGVTGPAGGRAPRCRAAPFRRVPAFHVPLPELPFDVLLTSMEPAPGGFVMRGVLTEWQRPLSRADIERLLATMRAET